MRSSGLYFMRNPLTGHIKIGVTNYVTERMYAMSMVCGCWLELLAFHRDMDAEIERSLHGFFAESRTVGEWFVPTPELRRLTEMNRAQLRKWIAENAEGLAAGFALERVAHKQARTKGSCKFRRMTTPTGVTHQRSSL